MTTKLSVNINKIATLRNARGGKMPNVVQAAIDIQNFGADGITIHPRPDERHITRQDAYDLAKVVHTEYNIEGYPSADFIKLVNDIKPTQVTLVPDPPNTLTSNAGWNTKTNFDLLNDVIADFNNQGIRTAIFMETDSELIELASKLNVNRLEFYTGPYAEQYSENKEAAIKDYILAADVALKNGLEINAGHDLSLENLKYFKQNTPNLAEVSIGHALIADALYLGLENTVAMYKDLLEDN